MRVLIFLVALVLLFLIFHKFKNDKDLNKEIFSVVLILVGLIVIYEYNLKKESKKITNILIAFKEGKKIECNGVKIDKNGFYFESGTMVFISKKIEDIKYPIQNCKVYGF